MALQEKFNEATTTVSKKINKTLTDEELKEVYGLYKQVDKNMRHSHLSFVSMKPKNCHRRQRWVMSTSKNQGCWI